jgi:hypothetical protein
MDRYPWRFDSIHSHSYDDVNSFSFNSKEFGLSRTSAARREECSIDKGIDFWLCNTVKKDKVVNCHQKYHSEMCVETTGGATESAVDSGLTEE